MAISQDNRLLLQRLKWIRIGLAVGLFFLVGKLWHITILQFDWFRQLAERNQIRTVPDPAPRGLILDREGRVLVDNIHTFNLLLFRDEATDIESTTQFLAEGLELTREELAERLEAARDYPLVQPVVLADNLTVEDAAFLLAHQNEHPELGVVERPRRRYRYGGLGAHVLGYVGEVSGSQLASPEFSGRKPGDTVGKYGLERRYNDHLTGVDGYHRVVVNSLGKSLEEVGRIAPQQGTELHLTLDLDLQRVAQESLQDRPGALVALDPRNGEILAMASNPSFDPNLFASRISTTQWKTLIQDPDHPLQNRAIQNSFSPGSIFKVITALAGLEKELIDIDSRVFCSGGIELYGHPFRCWKAGGHGWVALKEAIQHSCNVYFYLLGQKLGIAQIASFSRQLGLGQRTGIDLLGEVAGLVPSEEWKRRVSGQPWFKGETISVAIGQGPINVTPIQLARAMSTIATGVVPPPPRLVLQETAPAAGRLPLLRLDSTQAVRDALWSGVNEWGTGFQARVAGFDVCGKTGTVQTVSRTTLSQLSEEEQRRFEPNAWFVGYAPKEDPKLVVAVIVQRGGSGSAGAAPLAGNVFRTYYQKSQGDAVSLEVALSGQE